MSTSNIWVCLSALQSKKKNNNTNPNFLLFAGKISIR